jgi:hypothetical protein
MTRSGANSGAVAQWREEQRQRAYRYLDQRENGHGNEHEDARVCGMTVAEARDLLAWFEHDCKRRRVLGEQLDAYEDSIA